LIIKNLLSIKTEFSIVKSKSTCGFKLTFGEYTQVDNLENADSMFTKDQEYVEKWRSNTTVFIIDDCGKEVYLSSDQLISTD
jgi:hypothetical protein